MKKSTVVWQTALFLLQTLTGIGLIFFGALHLFGNSIINFGADSFNAYLSYLDHKNTLVQILIWLLIAGLTVHGLNGLRTILRYYKKIPEVSDFLADTKYRDSYLWLAHFASGIAIGIFVIVHLILVGVGAKEPVTTAQAIKPQVQNNYYFILLNLLLVAGIFHGFCGTRNILIKYGILLNYRKKIDVVLLIIGVVLIIIGINNLFVFRGLS